MKTDAFWLGFISIHVTYHSEYAIKYHRLIHTMIHHSHTMTGISSPIETCMHTKYQKLVMSVSTVRHF